MNESAASLAPMNTYWWIYLLQGILAFVLGGLLIFWPGPTLAILTTFLGIYWFFVGIFHIIGVFSGPKDRRRGWLLLTGILGIVAGLLVLARPFIATVLLPTIFMILVGVNGVLIGAVGLVQSIRGGGWGPAVWGVVSIVLGLLLAFNPLIAVRFLPWLLGAFAALGGLALIVMALQLRPRQAHA